MAITREKKEEILERIKDNLEKSLSSVFVQYSGVSANEMREVRDKLFDDKLSLIVAKKTLIAIAIKDKKIGEVDKNFAPGQIAISFAFEDEMVLTKTMNELCKKYSNLKIAGGIFEGKIISKDDVIRLANIPSKNVLITQFAMLIKSPITGFHGACKNLLQSLALVLTEVKKEKEKEEK